MAKCFGTSSVSEKYGPRGQAQFSQRPHVPRDCVSPKQHVSPRHREVGGNAPHVVAKPAVPLYTVIYLYDAETDLLPGSGRPVRWLSELDPS